MKNNNNYNNFSTNSVIEDSCFACPRQCGVRRDSSLGYCKSKGLRIARFGLHYWEEPCISGKEGSGTIFFSGCSLRCIYCQNYEVSQKSKGYDISTSELVDIFKKLEDMGANNINLVTPTHYIDYIIKALDIYRPNIPICYNTGGYESVESIKRLANYVDIFLVDFKYMDSNLALEFSKAKDYPQVAMSAIQEMKKNVPQDIFNEKGIMTKGIIVRHLVLPECLQNSKNVLLWIEKNLGKDTIVSIMSQYTPFGKAVGHNKIGRKLKPVEYKIIVSFAEKLGLEKAYIQEGSSADECFIPEFEGEIQNEL